MKTLLAAVLVMILLFSLGVGAYVSFFKIPLRNPGVKALAFLGLSAATAAVTFVLCLMIIWPPVM